MNRIYRLALNAGVIVFASGLLSAQNPGCVIVNGQGNTIMIQCPDGSRYCNFYYNGKYAGQVSREIAYNSCQN